MSVINGVYSSIAPSVSTTCKFDKTNRGVTNVVAESLRFLSWGFC